MVTPLPQPSGLGYEESRQNSPTPKTKWDRPPVALMPPGGRPQDLGSCSKKKKKKKKKKKIQKHEERKCGGGQRGLSIQREKRSCK